MLDDAGVAVLAVLLLRGPQTPGELKARTERLHAFADLAAIDGALQALATHEDGPFVMQLRREPGRKESRWRDLLQEPDDAEGSGAAATVGDPAADVAPVTSRATNGGDLAARVAALEAEVAGLRERLDGLANDAPQ